MSFEKQRMSKDKSPSIFYRQMEAIVLIILQIFFATPAVLKLGNILRYKRLKKVKMFKPNVFGCLPSSGLMMANPDDGKQPKTFGLNILIF